MEYPSGISEWDNELHPTTGGFRKIAKQFQSVIEGIQAA